jgi:amino acid permease
LAFLSSLFGNGTVYFWLLNASSLSGFIAWLGIAISHYRFRKAYVLQGHDLKKLPYVAKGYPYAPLLAFFLCIVIIAGQNYQAIIGKHVDWQGVVISYIGLPLFIALGLGYKFFKKTKLVDLKHASFTGEPLGEEDAEVL